ncbi:MAG: ligand-gated channel [Rhodobacterales bacterium]|nr:MAG: ligand-gated channel [Rhodobacterales bacterium]
MKHLAKAALATSAVTLGTPAFAEDVTDLDTIVISGSLTPLPQSRTAATVDILEEDALEDDTRPLSQTLSRLPGVSFSQSGPLGTNSSLSIRGLPARYIGVRIDGIDVSDASSTQTQFNFGGLAGVGVGRVEVLKGSQSALYGSEAVGGVVDITSSRPRKMGFSAVAKTEIGSYDTYSGSLMLGYMDDNGEVALNYARVKSDGFSALSSDTEADGMDQTQLNLTLRYALSDTVTVGGAVLYRDLSYDFDNNAFDPSGAGTTTQRGARVFADVVTGAVTHTLSYSRFESERDIVTSTYTSAFDSERNQIGYLANAELGGATLVFGLDRTEETYKTIGSAETRSAFAEVLLQPGDFDLSLAARYDDHSLFGGHWSGRMGAVWHVGASTNLRALVSTGFRAPSLNELYGPFGGNPALNPEKSRSAELGIEHQLGANGSLRGTLFYSEVDDLIQYFDPDGWLGPLPGGYTQRPGTTVSKGIELSGRYALSDRYELYGNYTYTDVRNAGTRLAQVPMHSAVLGLDARISPRLSGNIELQHVANVLPSAFAPAANKVGDHTLLNVGLDLELTDNAKAYLRIENLTDEDYETVGGYNQPGRSVYFGLRGEF